MQYLGKLDRNKLGKYKNKIARDVVVITNERIEHIKKKHPGVFEQYIKYIPDIIKNPDYILEDKDNSCTILMLKCIIEVHEKIQLVIKLQTQKNENMENSVLTFWKIRDRNYISTIKNNEILYKNLDIKE